MPEKRTALPARRAAPAGAPSSRIAFAHLLRGFAAASVLTHHFLYVVWREPQIVGTLIAQPSLPALVGNAPPFGVPDFGVPNVWGHFGVALFFLISGFVIPFSIASLSRSGFIVARVLRIWPTYIAGFSITLLCLGVDLAHTGSAFPYALRDVLSHYLILSRWPSLAQPIDGIIWTLEVELFFYGFCWLVSPGLRAFDRSVFLVAIASAPVAAVCSQAMPFMSASWPALFPLVHWAGAMMQFLPFLLAGTAFQYAYQGKLGRRPLAALHAGLLLAFVLSWRFGPMKDEGWSSPLSYLAAYSVFAAAYALRNTVAQASTLVHRPLAALADISYPLYVVHGILGYSIIAGSLQAGLDPAPAVLLALGAACAVAILLHVGVERPSRAFGKRLVSEL